MPSFRLALAFGLMIAATGAAGMGCSDGGGGPSDGGGTGGTGGSGGAPSDGGGGGADGGGSCTAPLTLAGFCASTYEDQVGGNPCDNDPTPTTRTCGSYKLWESLFIGSQACIYNAAGTTLVGARACDSVATPDCPNGCLTYGIPESNYATGCSADAPACP